MTPPAVILGQGEYVHAWPALPTISAAGKGAGLGTADDPTARSEAAIITAMVGPPHAHRRPGVPASRRTTKEAGLWA